MENKKEIAEYILSVALEIDKHFYIDTSGDPRFPIYHINNLRSNMHIIYIYPLNDLPLYNDLEGLNISSFKLTKFDLISDDHVKEVIINCIKNLKENYQWDDKLKVI